MVIWSTIVVDMIGFGIAIPVLGPYVEDRFGSTLGHHCMTEDRQRPWGDPEG